MALSEVIRTRLIPWTQHDAGRRFIMARPQMREQDMPAGVTLSPCELVGKRRVVKNNRSYSNVRNILAQWPGMGLYELNKYALVCVLDGFIDYQIGSYKIKCGPGHFLFIPPGTPHPNGTRSYVDVERGAACDIITFLLHPNAIESWMSHGDLQGREKSNPCLILHDRAITLLQAIMEELDENEDRAMIVTEAMILAFFNVLLREAEMGRVQYMRISEHHQSVAAGGGNQADFATRLELYIRSNLRKPLTLARVSRDMYLSPAQFARNVRRETGETFHQVLTRHRLESAKSLLRDSEWSVSIIATRVGFQSSSYFCARFKQHIGQSPGEFRLQRANGTIEQ